jgi:hypothetical protein
MIAFWGGSNSSSSHWWQKMGTCPFFGKNVQKPKVARVIMKKRKLIVLEGEYPSHLLATALVSFSSNIWKVRSTDSSPAVAVITSKPERKLWCGSYGLGWTFPKVWRPLVAKPSKIQGNTAEFPRNSPKRVFSPPVRAEKMISARPWTAALSVRLRSLHHTFLSTTGPKAPLSPKGAAQRSKSNRQEESLWKVTDFRK